MPKIHSPAQLTRSSGTSLSARDILTLRSLDGTPHQLTSTQLEHWFAETERSLKQDAKQKPSEEDTKTAELSTRFISRFGIKTPRDIIVFLNSPAGKATKAIISEKLAHIAHLHDHFQGEQLLNKLKKKRKLVFLLLGLVYKRKARAHQINDAVARDIEKRAKEFNKAKALNQTNTIPVSFDGTAYIQLGNALAYAFASKSIEDTLNQKLKAAKALEKELAEIDEKIEQHLIKYTLYSQFIDAVYQDMEQYPDFSMMPIEMMHQNMTQIMEKIDMNSSKIIDLLNMGQDLEARELLMMSHALNLQLELYKDMLSVTKGTKHLYTITGEPTTSFANAHFILSRQKKIVCEHGRYFLLPIDKDILQLSVEEKNEGEQAYFHHKPDIMGVRQLVEHNQRLEETEHNETKSQLLTRSEAMQQDILLLVKQLTLMEASETKATLSLKPPKPTNTPHPQSNQPCMTNSYRHMLLLMKNNPTTKSINWLKEILANANNSPELQKQLNELTPGKPIPPEMMSELLKKRDLGRRWLDVRSPDVVVKEPSNQPTAPSPFSMTPFHRKPV